MTSDGDWMSDGEGVFCTLGDKVVCTEPVKGDHLGALGDALLRIELP